MALVLKKLYLGYHWMFEEISDPRPVDMGLFLMSSPMKPVLVLTLYFYFIYNLGPKLMANRKPFQFKNVIIVYNLLQVLVNCFIVVEAAREAWYNMDWNCTPVDYSNNPRSLYVLKLYHLFFLTKLADLLETIFFVLRKKSSQVSFLHVYHHFGMFTMLWIAVKFFGGGHANFVGLINGAVHSVMYIYYLLSAIDESWKNSLKFKKAITQLQIVQFIAFILIYGRLLLLPDCTYPKLCSYFFVPQNCFMLLLFGDFYRKTYLSKKAKGTKEN